MSLCFRLRHRFPSVMIDIAFDVHMPGVTALFGPSGAGKSSVIAAAAGLLHPDDCRIEVDGQVLADIGGGICCFGHRGLRVWTSSPLIVIPTRE